MNHPAFIDWPFRCPCGRVYDRAEFLELDGPGRVDQKWPWGWFHQRQCRCLIWTLTACESLEAAELAAVPAKAPGGRP